MKYFIYLVLIGFSFQSCEKQNIKPYGNDHYVQFTKLYTDTLNCSFFFYVDDQVDIPLEIKLIGDVFTEDTPLSLLVNERETTAPAALFDLPETFTFSKGQIKDTVYLRLNRAGIVEGDKTVYSLVVDIINNDHILVGEPNYSRRVLMVSNVVTKPDWWNAETEKALGKYTLKKFTKFKEVTQVGDLTGWTWNAKRIIALEFKNYLRKYEPEYTDEDGSIMWKNLPVMGS